MTQNQDPAVSAAMQILLAAGASRKLVGDAIGSMASADFEGARTRLVDARAALQAAHQVHTDVIQAEAAGTAITFPALFSHAQDAMMTTDSEIRLVKRLVTVFEGVEARLAGLEAATATASSATAGEGTR